MLSRSHWIFHSFIGSEVSVSSCGRRRRFLHAEGERSYTQRRHDAAAIDRAKQQKRDRKRNVFREPSKRETHRHLQNRSDHRECRLRAAMSFTLGWFAEHV